MPIIRCAQYQFTISDPFTPGHPLSPEEAQALNALRAENIRNNLAQQVRKRTEGLRPGDLLAGENLAELNALAADYDANYQFGARRAYTREGPIEIEAKQVARSRVLASARAAGQTLSEDDLSRLVAEQARQADVLDEARRRVGEHQRVATGALESLI
jgi:hypothetical protein